MAHSLKVVHVAGFNSCGFFQRAMNVLRSVSILFPQRLKIVEHEFQDRPSYRAWLLSEGVENGEAFRNCFQNEPAALSHSSSPFVWLTKGENADGSDIECYLGGHDDTIAWCRTFLTATDDKTVTQIESLQVDDGHKADHGFDYDLVVIGGGSGGMAAAKEATRFGAKVACLDFVKPSPAGSTWGLGGTCVNVGCIPKKLFHAGSLLRESIQSDAAAYGLDLGGSSNGDNLIEDAKANVRWEVLSENIQNYIRSLNFKYRVRLREKEVTYINKLAKFVDEHTIEATDKKGVTSTITASRFLIAVGGRPTALECEGGDLAISSDDVFSLNRSPGRTLCVGASYISLECAGFLNGLGLDVTVAVRSILLRGFDRECSDRIEKYMEQTGVKFRREVTPEKLLRTETGQINVLFSNGSEDTYDTVLAAVGRKADTDNLGLEKLGIKVNPKNCRIIGKNEQTDCPNVYAVGDVLDGTPELTPVAIQAGILLAQRLFNKSNDSMDYTNICTTVFTPIEYACVGISEDDAVSKLGKENVEVYHREFVPLEWSMSLNRGHHSSFAKIVVDKTPDENVLGIHYVGPHAGEVMQGYGVSMKVGLTYKQLVDTVGIHPTSSEEIVSLAISKNSGEDAAAGGC